MGSDRIKIRYVIFKRGHWVWRPTKAMRAAGFRPVHLSVGHVIGGKRVMSAPDIDRARALNAEWDRHRRGLPPLAPRPGYPTGSIGEAYLRVMRLREAERRAKGVAWTKEQSSRDDWPRAWKWIGKLLGDCDPRTVTPEQLIGDPAKPEEPGLRPLVAAKVSETEAHRVIKVWRALWQRMAALKYCDRDTDPFQFANTAPQPRQAVWREGEAVRLVKRAWREGYHGLAALLAVAWDSQLSPVDARNLSAGQRRRDPVGTFFQTGRTKTGRSALATLSRRTEAVLDAYLAELGAAPVGAAPIFRNCSGAPYSKDTLGDDFRAVRTMVFGEAERRQLADFRRSGTVEAFAGDAPPEKVSAKMANTLSQSNKLHQTYAPPQLASVRDADAARRRGRVKLRGEGGAGERKLAESVPPPAQKCPAATNGGS
jgi:hypothetical protein